MRSASQIFKMYRSTGVKSLTKNRKRTYFDAIEDATHHIQYVVCVQACTGRAFATTWDHFESLKIALMDIVDDINYFIKLEIWDWSGEGDVTLNPDWEEADVIRLDYLQKHFKTYIIIDLRDEPTIAASREIYKRLKTDYQTPLTFADD